MVFKNPFYLESDKKLNEFDGDNKFKKQSKIMNILKIKHMTEYIIKF